MELWWGSAEESGTPPFTMVCNIVRLLFVYPQTLTCTSLVKNKL